MLNSAKDRERVAAAIGEAEKHTSGEIVAVVATASASYVSVAPLVAALVALLVPWPLIYFTWWPVQWIYLLQLAVFLVVASIIYYRPIRMALVPASIKRDRAHKRAVEQFLAQNLYTTDGHTGVLIFLSAAEHYAEIIADRNIYKLAPQDEWQAMVDRLTSRIGDGRAADGLIETIEAAGALLSKHYPPGSGSTNELPNHLIVID
jgi:putative membrane protein